MHWEVLCITAMINRMQRRLRRATPVWRTYHQSNKLHNNYWYKPAFPSGINKWCRDKFLNIDTYYATSSIRRHYVAVIGETAILETFGNYLNLQHHTCNSTHHNLLSIIIPSNSDEKPDNRAKWCLVTPYTPYIFSMYCYCDCKNK